MALGQQLKARANGTNLVNCDLARYRQEIDIDKDGKMKRISVALIMCAGLLLLVNLARAEERERCSNASLYGNFGLRATGAIIDSGNIIVLVRFTYDGKGNLTAKLFLRLPDATNSTDTITGTYSVSPDCTVSDVWHSVISGSDSFHESVLVNRGHGFFILNTTEGAPVVISGEAKRQ